MVAPVEPPAALFQKPRNTIFVDAVEAEKILPGLPPQVLNSVDMMTTFADKHVAVVDSSLVKLQHIQCVTHLRLKKVSGVFS